MKDKESIFVKKQRQAIEKHLAENVLRTSVLPSSAESIYSRPPSQPEQQELYDQAQGDPTLFAILIAVQNARQEREAANISNNQDRINDSVLALDEVKELELHYRYPGEVEFEP